MKIIENDIRAIYKSGINDINIEDYKDIFEGVGKLGKEYNIKLDESVTPTVHAPRRVPFAL